MVKNRVCRDCRQSKPLDIKHFPPAVDPDGLGRRYYRSRCRPCYTTSRYDYLAEWSQENPESLAIRKHKHRQSARYRQTQIAYQPKQRENSKRYRQTEYGQQMIAARYALRRGAMAGEAISRKQVWLRDARKCRLCNKMVTLKSMHLDHVVPVAKGGTHTYDNVQTTHRVCNQRKGAK